MIHLNDADLHEIRELIILLNSFNESHNISLDNMTVWYDGEQLGKIIMNDDNYVFGWPE